MVTSSVGSSTSAVSAKPLAEALAAHRGDATADPRTIGRGCDTVRVLCRVDKDAKWTR